MADPRVSVLMACRDTEWVGEAVWSLAAQTCDEWELVLVDDGSVRPAVVVSLQMGQEKLGERLVLIRHAHPAGLTRSLIEAERRARGEVLARLDADDVAAPGRLAAQLAFLDAHPEVGVLGSQATLIDPRSERIGDIRVPEKDAAIRRAMPWRNPVVHSSAMIRQAVYLRAGGYNPAFDLCQDYDLWLRCLPLTRFANLPGELVARRMHPTMLSIRFAQRRRLAELRARWRALVRGDLPLWVAGCLVKPAAALACGAVVGISSAVLRQGGAQ